MTELPDPPVPSGSDLRAFPFTPIFRARLFSSRFHARVTDAEWRAGVTLWLKSWDQVPAGSLPDDDVDLCRLAELGRDLRTWAKIKTRALHGWFKASDGLLYHKVVAEGVNEALAKCSSHSKRGAKGAAARWSSHSNGMLQPSVKNASAIQNGSHKHKNVDANGMANDAKREGEGEGDRIPPVSPPAEPRPRPKARSQIGADWQPNEAGVAYAKARGVNRAEVQKFVNHHIAHGKLMADWNAAWRTWCDNAVKFGNATPLLDRANSTPTGVSNGFG